MTKSEMAAKLNGANAWLPGKRVKIDFGEQGTVLLDGVANQVTEENGAADTTIKVSWDDWQALSSGQIDGMTAFMQGKLKVEGDMSAAASSSVTRPACPSSSTAPSVPPKSILTRLPGNHACLSLRAATISVLVMNGLLKIWPHLLYANVKSRAALDAAGGEG